MRNITEITRRDIIDLIRDGFEINVEIHVKNADFTRIETEQIKLNYWGRLSELEFLARLYDLENMVSSDSRFSNAYRDIWQHTVNNDDWDYCWVFSDSRFNLTNGNDDITLLKFISEMLHPAVRVEKEPWQEYLKKFNQLLNVVGYELYEKSHISGRSVYDFRQINHIDISNPYEKMHITLKLIGEGSYAKVFKYKDPFYQKEYALKRAKKELNDKEIKRFKREFDEMNSLKSPYVVEVYSYSEERNEYIMAYMDLTLDKYLEKNNAVLKLKQREKIIWQIIKAVEYIHSKGLLHRDISPKNVLLKQYDDTLIIKLSDFGLVKIIDSDLTSENTDLKGSLNDPSLKTEGFSKYNILHEIYALTLLMIYILTGTSNYANIKEPNIIAFMNKGTNSNKAERYQNVNELKKAVSDLLDAIGR